MLISVTFVRFYVLSGYKDTDTFFISTTTNKSGTYVELWPYQNDENGTFTLGNETTLWKSELFTGVYNAKINILRNKLFFFDANTASIYVVDNLISNTSDQPVRRLHYGTSHRRVKIAVDWVSNNIYWTEPSYKVVMVQAFTTNKAAHTLISENLGEPLGIAVDPLQK